MEFALFWLPIIGGIILGGFAGNAWYGGDKKLAMWLAFFGLISFELLAVLQIQQKISKAQASAEDQRPRNADRPWLAVTRFEPVNFQTGKIPRIVVRLENIGREPALEMRATVTATISPATQPAPVAPTHKDDAVPQTIIPSSGLDYRMLVQAPPLTQEHVDGIRTQTWFVWVVGKIDYLDASHISHSTEFCYRFDPTREGFSAHFAERNTAN